MFLFCSVFSLRQVDVDASCIEERQHVRVLPSRPDASKVVDTKRSNDATGIAILRVDSPSQNSELAKKQKLIQYIWQAFLPDSQPVRVLKPDVGQANTTLRHHFMPMNSVIPSISARSAEILDEALRRIELSLPDQDLGPYEVPGKLSLGGPQDHAVLKTDRWVRVLASSCRWLS